MTTLYRAGVGAQIPVGDLVTYAEAVAITGRSHGYLAKLARQGQIARMGGQRSDVYATFLSRAECETLAYRSTAGASTRTTG
jgi:hypothetical protein